METETIDRLFLELSQVTGAATAKEIDLQQQLDTLRKIIAANHEWHQNYDDYGGYTDSDLYKLNISGLLNTARSTED